MCTRPDTIPKDPIKGRFMALIDAKGGKGGQLDGVRAVDMCPRTWETSSFEDSARELRSKGHHYCGFVDSHCF